MMSPGVPTDIEGGFGQSAANDFRLFELNNFDV